MNEYSSRSHTVFRLHLECRGTNNERSVANSYKHATLAFVDLAGSERVRLTGSEGIRLKEGGHINRSLLTLATVISKLAERSGHVPFRDSKLTRILQPCLTGASRTLIIAAVTPEVAFVDESLSTLKFASRAKSIQLSRLPTVNEVIPLHERLAQTEERLRVVCEERDVLKRETLQLLASIRDGIGVDVKQAIADLAFILQHIETDISTHLNATRQSLSQNYKLIKNEHFKTVKQMEQQLVDTEERLMDEMAQLLSNQEQKTPTILNSFVEMDDLDSIQMLAAELEQTLEQQLEHYHKKHLELSSELTNRQEDIDQLLAKVSSQQSEMRYR